MHHISCFRITRLNTNTNAQVLFVLFWLLLTVVTLLQGDELMVKVNKLTSTKTQLPYSYYSLPFCKPEKILDSAENLGEVLRGDRIENSPYVVSFFFFFKMLKNYLFCGGSIYRRFIQEFSPRWLRSGQICILQFKMREPQMCNVLCRVVLNAKSAKEFQEKIEDEYRVNM